MVEGLFSAAAGMAAQQQRLDAISNDIANVDTDGYQSERVGFQDLLYSPAGVPSGATVATGAGAKMMMLGTSQTQGALQTTGRTLDVALVGPGYLEVRQANGAIGLTRDGSLQIDNRGQLVTADGSIVQPPITFPASVTDDKVAIDSTGTVRANGRTYGRLSIVTVAAPSGLLASGKTTFTPTAASGAPRAVPPGTIIRQGTLEASNVDLSNEMVNMLDAQRSYSLDGEAIKMQQQMGQTADQVKS
jgi:flagellar basal-body rod protein FlgG